MKGETSLTRTPATYAACTGEGEPAAEIEYGTAICPVCRGIAQVTEDNKIDAHTLRVI